MGENTAYTPGELLTLWNDQQTAFIEFRAQRSHCVAEVLKGLGARNGRKLRILDLGCGPGSLSNAILDEIPDARITGVDRDPVLLRLFKESTPYSEQVELVDASLTDPHWVKSLPESEYDAAISATALHWLQPEQLTALYLSLYPVLAPGGMVINADHLMFNAQSAPYMREFAISFRDTAEERMRAAGAMSWDAWWEAALTQPGWEVEAAEHEKRWANKCQVKQVSSEFHLAALQAAGFTESTQIWQWLDDRITYARKPEKSA